MIDKIIAYDREEVEQFYKFNYSKNLLYSGVISEEQWQFIAEKFRSEIYNPKVFIKVILLLVTIVGLSFGFGILLLTNFLFDDWDEISQRIGLIFIGAVLIGFTELVLIKGYKHLNSGVTEAIIYAGTTLVMFGFVGFDFNNPLMITLLACIVATLISLRYLDQIGTILSLVFFYFSIFIACNDIGGFIKALMPFIFMLSSLAIVFGSLQLQKWDLNSFFKDHLILVKAISLFMFYLSGNYFVVRELSVELMNLNISEGQDIPFAILFYLFTILIPVVYFYLGIRGKSLLYIRVSLLCIILSLATLQYYSFYSYAELYYTVIGFFAIILAIALFRALKKNDSEFTSDRLVFDKWNMSPAIEIVGSSIVDKNIGDSPESDKSHSW